MSDIFLSYASEDQARAKKLAAALEAQGWTVFWDLTIPPGQSWQQVTSSQLNAARCVVVAWSQTSIHRHWVLEEADIGLARGALVPVLLDTVKPPIGFRSIQATDLQDWQGNEQAAAFRRLVEAVSEKIGRPALASVIGSGQGSAKVSGIAACEIFLAYAREDLKRAQKLAFALEAQGWTVFWDLTIPPGQTWQEVISSQLNAARCVVVAWSKASIQSRWVREEAESGLERGILLAALLDAVKPPLGFRSILAADLQDWQGDPQAAAFRKLVEAVASILGWPGPAPAKAETPPKPVDKLGAVWLVFDRPVWRKADGRLIDRLAGLYQDAPFVLAAQGGGDILGEHLRLADRQGRLKALFPEFAAELADWGRLLPPAAGWRALPHREIYPCAALLPTAVQTLRRPQDWVLLIDGDSVERWRGLLPLEQTRVLVADADGLPARIAGYQTARPIDRLGGQDAAAASRGFLAAARRFWEQRIKQAVGGVAEAPARIEPAIPQTEPPPRPPISLYTVGSPVLDDQHFAGRADLLERLLKLWSRTDAKPAVALVGQRRIGKTSLLYKIQRDGLPGSGLLPLVVNLASTRTGGDVVFAMADAIANLLNVPRPKLEPDAPYSGFKDFLREIASRRAERGFLLMLDEVEWFCAQPDAGQALPGFLRALAEDPDHLVSLLLVGSPALKSPLLNFCQFYTLGCLDEAESYELLEKPALGILEFSREALAEAYRLTHGHPYLLQSLGELVYRLPSREAGQAGVLVTPKQIHEAASQMGEEHGGRFFSAPWIAHDEDAAWVLAALAEATDETPRRSRRTLAELEAEARTDGRRDLNVRAVVKRLVDEEALLQDRQGVRFAVPLFRQWAARATRR